MIEKVYKDYTEEGLRNHFKERGFSVVEINLRGKYGGSLSASCNKGHIFSDKISAMMVRKVCVRCTSIKYKDNLDSRLAANGFRLISNVPDITSSTVVQVVCDKGHVREGVLSLYIHDRGCKVCAGREVSEEIVKKDLLEKGYELLGEFTYVDRPYSLIHKVCGKQFSLKTLLNIRNNRSGCPHCGNLFKKTNAEIEVKLNSSGWSMDTELELKGYKDSIIDATCLDCGFVRKGRLSNYLNKGTKCPVCNDIDKTSIQPDSPASVYYLKVIHNNVIYYKIGITCKDYRQRFNRDLSRSDIHIELISQLDCDKRYKARQIEQHFLTTYSKYRYKGSPILLSGGDTELFTEDVLELDT